MLFYLKKWLLNRSGESGQWLRNAAELGKLESIKDLVAWGVNINDKNQYGDTALIVATRRGRAEAAELLLQSGADMHATSNDGWSALYIAVLHKQSDMAKLLLNHGANPEQADNSGDTPFTRAISSKDAELIPIFETAVKKRAADCLARDTSPALSRALVVKRPLLHKKPNLLSRIIHAHKIKP